MLHPGDRVLVRNVGLRGKQKLADRWERQAYIVKYQPNPDIPNYEVQLENSRSRKARTIHRNLLLPFMFLSRGKQRQSGVEPEIALDVTDDHETGNESRDIDDSVKESDNESVSDTASQNENQVPRYVIPLRRIPGTPALNPRSEVSVVGERQRSRPVRERRKRHWMTSNDWVQ